MNKHQKKVHKITKHILLFARAARLPEDYKLVRQIVREHFREENSRDRSK